MVYNTHGDLLGLHAWGVRLIKAQNSDLFSSTEEVGGDIRESLVEIHRGGDGLQKRALKASIEVTVGPILADSHSALPWIKACPQKSPRGTVQTELPLWNIYSFLAIVMSEWSNPELPAWVTLNSTCFALLPLGSLPWRFFRHLDCIVARYDSHFPHKHPWLKADDTWP